MWECEDVEWSDTVEEGGMGLCTAETAHGWVGMQPAEQLRSGWRVARTPRPYLANMRCAVLHRICDVLRNYWFDALYPPASPHLFLLAFSFLRTNHPSMRTPAPAIGAAFHPFSARSPQPAAAATAAATLPSSRRYCNRSVIACSACSPHTRVLHSGARSRVILRRVGRRVLSPKFPYLLFSARSLRIHRRAPRTTTSFRRR